MKRGRETNQEKNRSVYAEQRRRQLGYWQGKTPCWEMLHCPETIREQCPVFRKENMPGWEIGGLYCQLFDSRGGIGNFTDVCRLCRVYRKWGHGELDASLSNN